MLKDAEDLADVELVVTAMKILPITKIEAGPAKVPSTLIGSHISQKRVDRVMAFIQRDGSPMNTNWVEK